MIINILQVFMLQPRKPDMIIKSQRLYKNMDRMFQREAWHYVLLYVSSSWSGVFRMVWDAL